MNQPTPDFPALGFQQFAEFLHLAPAAVCEEASAGLVPAVEARARLLGLREAEIDVSTPLAIPELDYLCLLSRPHAGIIDA